ncbi:MAG: hypothetical protein WBA46_04585 [Thermomicrobiales bacterium]
MTVIALTRTTPRPRVEIVESIEQRTLAADEAITPGDMVRINGDRFTKGNGTTATEAAVYGMAVGDRVVPAGMAITAIKRGTVYGHTFDGNTNTKVYLSDTDGKIDTAAGTVSVVVGEIVPGTATPRGATPQKMLRIAL